MSINTKTLLWLKVTDFFDGVETLINLDDVSRIVNSEEGGSTVYFREVADDFDGTKHQVSVRIVEGVDEIVQMIRMGI